VLNGDNMAPPIVVPTDLPPVAGAQVVLPAFGISTTTDDTGHFVLTGVPFQAPYSKTTVAVMAAGFGTWTLNGAPLRQTEMDLTVILNQSPQTTNEVPPEEASPSRLQAPPAQPVADSPCSNYSDNSDPPSTISVYLLNEGGGVVDYSFQYYVEHVLPNEWVPSWPSASLEAGAIAVKEYAWYWVNNWRGGSHNGQCYDVDDSTNYQYFCASCATYTSTNTAISQTWQWLARQNGSIFETSYVAGNYTCANVNGIQMYQDGSYTCAQQGLQWQQIVSTFYSNVAWFANAAPTSVIASNGAVITFWEGADGNLWQALGQPTGALAGPYKLGMGPLGSAPSVAYYSPSNATFVYWEGGDGNLWEAYWNGSQWVGPYDRGMGPLGSAPTAVIGSNGDVYVFWRGTDGSLYQALGNPTEPLSGPNRLGMGPLGSAPSVAIYSPNNATFVYWVGSNGDLTEAYWNGSQWVGPYDRGMGTLGSVPSAVIGPSGNVYVHWRGTDSSLYQALGNPTEALSGPNRLGMGPLGSAPTVSINSSNVTFVYWEGMDGNLWEGYWTSSGWVGPYSRGMGPL